MVETPPAGLVPVDRLDVLVLVDNNVDPLSTNPVDVRPELANLVAAGMKEWSGATSCVGHHGLSLLVTAHAGTTTRTVLFDFGPEGATLARNAARLGADLGVADAFVLSHGHWDHAGGLLVALGLAHESAKRGRKAPVPVYMHPGMFGHRGIRLPSGAVVPFQDVPPPAEIGAKGGSAVQVKEPQLVADRLFYVSGEIPRTTPYEQGFPNHVTRDGDGAWRPDPLLPDERFLAVHVKDKGLVVFTACSHAGVVNVLTHARETFAGLPLHAVVGGLHLAGPGPERIISETVRDVARFGLRRVGAGHCTGWRAVQALVGALGPDVVVPLASGKHYAF